MPGEGQKFRIERHRARLHVVLRHQGPGIVQQHLLGDSVEVPKGGFQAREPARLPLVQEGAHIRPARVAERGHEQVHLHWLVANHNARLAKVHLQLLAWRGLEPHRRTRQSRKLSTVASDRPLYRPQADPNTVLAGKVLAHDVGVAAMLQEPLADERLQSQQTARRWPRSVRHPAALPQVPLHRRAAAAKLPRDPLASPSECAKAQHRRDGLRCLHRFGSRKVPESLSVRLLHSDSLLSERGSVFSVVGGSVLHVA